MKALDLRRKLEKDHPRSIYTGAELEDIVIPRLPSGSFAFDMVTGGGIPKNRFTVFHGPKSSSKSTFALRLAGMMQTLKPDMSFVYLDFEGTFDWKWAGCYIPDRDRAHIVRPDYGEEGINIAKEYAAQAEDLGLIIIDSLAGIVPTAEADAHAEDYTQLGLQVRLVNRLIRILIPHMSRASKTPGRELTVIAVNQIRANMNRTGPYGPTFSQPCGKFLEHAASMDIRFYPGEYGKTQNVPITVKHKFQVDKNKVGIPKRSGEFTYYLAEINGYHPGELEEEKVVLTYAKRAGIVTREGNKWIIPAKKENYVYGSLIELMKAFKEDVKLFTAVKKATLKACLANPFLSADEAEEKEKP